MRAVLVPGDVGDARHDPDRLLERLDAVRLHLAPAVAGTRDLTERGQAVVGDDRADRGRDLVEALHPHEAARAVGGPGPPGAAVAVGVARRGRVHVVRHRGHLGFGEDAAEVEEPGGLEEARISSRDESRVNGRWRSSGAPSGSVRVIAPATCGDVPSRAPRMSIHQSRTGSMRPSSTSVPVENQVIGVAWSLTRSSTWSGVRVSVRVSARSPRSTRARPSSATSVQRLSSTAIGERARCELADRSLEPLGAGFESLRQLGVEPRDRIDAPHVGIDVGCVRRLSWCAQRQSLLAERGAAHLAGVVAERFVDELERARDLVAHEPVGEVLAELVVGRARRRPARSRGRGCRGRRRGVRSRSSTRRAGARRAPPRSRPGTRSRRRRGSCRPRGRRGRGSRPRPSSPCRRATPSRRRCGPRRRCSGRWSRPRARA